MGCVLYGYPYVWPFKFALMFTTPWPFILGFLRVMLVENLYGGVGFHLLMVLLVFGVGQSAEGMYLTPKLVGDQIGLHPVTVIFAVLAGGQLFGFLGILLALPVAAALNVLVRHVHDKYRQSELYNSKPEADD